MKEKQSGYLIFCAGKRYWVPQKYRDPFPDTLAYSRKSGGLVASAYWVEEAGSDQEKFINEKHGFTNE